MHIPEYRHYSFFPLNCTFLLQLFEGLKAYRGVDDKIRLFRPDRNMKRMNLAAQSSGLPTFDGEELIKCICRLIQIDQEWVPHSETSTLYIRPTLIGTEVKFAPLYRNTKFMLLLKSAYYCVQKYVEKLKETT